MNSSFRHSLALLLTFAASGFFLVFCLGPSLALAQIPESYGLDLGIPPPHKSTPSSHPRRGVVFDRDALTQVRSFCVDTRHLEGIEAVQVNEFVAEESKPGKLMSRLPWTLVDDCTKADAVARIYFAPVEVTDVTEDKGSGLKKTSRPRQVSQPVLLIYDKASIRLFYRTESSTLEGDRMNVLGSPFTMLAKDLRATAQ
jgi:hypothetical protein